jgi:hypothetical protein
MLVSSVTKPWILALAIGGCSAFVLPACSSDDNSGGSSDGGSDSSSSTGGSGGSSGGSTGGSAGSTGGSAGSGGSTGGSAGSGGSTSDGGMMDGGHMPNMEAGACEGGDEYMAGMEKEGENGKFTVVLVSSDPEPAELTANGDYEWTIKILDSSGDPVDDADVNSTPMMPAMGHGTPRQETVTNNGDGTYTLMPVNLFMGGLWEITIVVDSGGETDNVTFSFCIPGAMMGMDGGMMGMDGGMMGMDGGSMGMDGGSMGMDGGSMGMDGGSMSMDGGT